MSASDLDKKSAKEPTGVGDRFRFLLESTGLSRDEFVDAVDHAVSARSLFSILNGSRNPSRALAVLIERTWGFRAEYLLDGRGPTWTGPAPEPEASPPGAERVLTFMQGAPENARVLMQQTERAELWNALFGQVVEMLDALATIGNSESPWDVAAYPAAAQLAWAECMFRADHFETLVSLSYRRRTHRLVDRFLDTFVDEIPGAHLSAAEADELAAALDRIRAQRARALDAIEESIAGVRRTLHNIIELGPPDLYSTVGAGAHGSSDRFANALEAFDASKHLDASERDTLESFIDSLDTGAAQLWPRLEKLVVALSDDVPTQIPAISEQTIEQLRRAKSPAPHL